MHDIPLIVISYDRYADLWKPFFTFFWKWWPDCPFQVYLGTNHQTYEDSRVISIKTGNEVTWATRLRRLLDRLDKPYVLTFLEDFLIEDKVDTARVVRLAQVAVQNRVGCLRLAPKPAPSEPVDGYPELGRILPGDPYRITSQVSFWKADTLRSLLSPEYSIWDFEFKGSISSLNLADPLWCVWQPAIKYQHCIERGQWLPWGRQVCRQAGIEIDLKYRPPVQGREMWRQIYYRLRGRVFWSLPRATQRKRWARIVERYANK